MKDGLTERERRFVEAFMGPAAGNATKAAELAGYSKKSASRIGYRLSRKVQVRKAIEDRADNDPKAATREERQRFWTDVMLGRAPFTEAGMRDRLKASELLGKSQGDFVDTHVHTGPGGKPIETRVTFGGRYRKADAANG